MARPFRKLRQRKLRPTFRDTTRRRIGRNSSGWERKELRTNGKRKTKKEFTQSTRRTQRALRRAHENALRLVRRLFVLGAAKKEGRAKARPYTNPSNSTPRKAAPTETERNGYSWEAESPPEAPSEEAGLWVAPPAAALCCFSRASRMSALRERRTLLPSMERTLTRTWSPSFSSSGTSRMRCSGIFLMCRRPAGAGNRSARGAYSARARGLPGEGVW